jgi:hypothetical protein
MLEASADVRTRFQSLGYNAIVAVLYLISMSGVFSLALHDLRSLSLLNQALSATPSDKGLHEADLETGFFMFISAHRLQRASGLGRGRFTAGCVMIWPMLLEMRHTRIADIPEAPVRYSRAILFAFASVGSSSVVQGPDYVKRMARKL